MASREAFVIVLTIKPVIHALALPVSPAFADVRRCFGAVKNVLEIAMTSATGSWVFPKDHGVRLVVI